MKLVGKNVLITGGGSGIGLAVALALAQQGSHVVCAGRNEKRLQTAIKQCWTQKDPILTKMCDVSDRQSVALLFAWIRENLGPLDILVNNAGINIPNRAMADLDPTDWDKTIGINLTGAFNCIHAALPDMRARKSGWIVNISSIAGKRAMKLGGASYCAAKFGMTALGTTVGLEERIHGIHVTNIYPGEVNTPILADRPTPVPPEKLEQMLMPQDIADMVVAIAKLPNRALVPELVITPLYQDYS